MAKFEDYAPLLKAFEGGFVNDCSDPGGATMMGVTLATFRQYYGQNKSVNDLKMISNEQWTRIMRTYWDRVLADKIANQSVANMLVDWVVNAGFAVIKNVQSAFGCIPDGVIGSKSLAAINETSPIIAFSKIQSARVQYYISLAEKNPTKKKFLAGWLSRVNKIHFAK